MAQRWAPIIGMTGFDGGTKPAISLATRTGRISNEEEELSPSTAGACCYVDGSCEVITETDCNNNGGTYQGDGTDCDPNPCVICPPTSDNLTMEFSGVSMACGCHFYDFYNQYVEFIDNGINSTFTLVYGSVSPGEWGDSVEHIANFMSGGDDCTVNSGTFNGFILVSCGGGTWSILATADAGEWFSASGSGSLPIGTPINNQLTTCTFTGSRPVVGTGGTVTITI